MEKPLVIVVTGTSRGVGKGIVQVLAKQQLNRPLIIYATSRSGASPNIQPSPPNQVHHAKLDTCDPSSIQALIHSLLEHHPAIDILINNAAVSNDYRESPAYAAETVNNNYAGTRDVCAAFLSDAKMSTNPGARIVNLTSGYNALSTYGAAVQTRFRTANEVSDIDGLAEDYVRDDRQGQDAQQEAGWGSGARSYKVSKALINALTIVLAQQYPGVLVNSCCPGWTDTDMGRQANGTPPKTAEEGARTAVRLAIGDLGPGGDEDGGLGRESESISGRFYENDNIVVPGWGKAKLWLDT